jgi:hypothetical protein
MKSLKFTKIFREFAFTKAYTPKGRRINTGSGSGTNTGSGYRDSGTGSGYSDSGSGWDDSGSGSGYSVQRAIDRICVFACVAVGVGSVLLLGVLIGIYWCFFRV